MPRAKTSTAGTESTDGAVMTKAKKPTRAVATKGVGKGAGVARKKPSSSSAHSLPPPLPLGETLTDLNKRQWKLGPSVGKGGFGEIYTATPSSTTKHKTGSSQYVIKVEPHENGPLFTELSFYRRSAKEESITEWIRSHHLKYLGVPAFIGSGLHVSTDGTEYRFMVMERFGNDIEKLFCEAGRVFNTKTVCYLALRLIEALEYLHESEYVHADIKGSNLLTGYSPDTRHQVYLVDYGLAYRYGPEEEHKDYKPDPKRSHDGTIEFTSIDAHDGAKPSRRGDMEILGYCLLQWACGRLPWESHLDNKPKVASVKTKYKSSPVTELMRDCFKDKPIPSCLEKYMKLVYQLSYKDRPDYENMKKLFHKELKDTKMKDDEKGLDWIEGTKGKGGKKASPQKRMVLEISPVKDDTDLEISAPPVKKRNATSTSKKTTAKDSSKPAPLTPSKKTTTKASTLKNSTSLSPPVKRPLDESQNEEESSPSKRLPVRASKILAQKLIKQSVTSPSSTVASTSEITYKEREEEEIILKDTTRPEKAVAGTKRKKSPIGSHIIPGLEEPDATITTKKARSTLSTKRKKPSVTKTLGSDIIPGVETSNNNHHVSSSSSTIIPEGHYPSQLGYTQSKKRK